jgi:DnaK suppressor protein
MTYKEQTNLRAALEAKRMELASDMRSRIGELTIDGEQSDPIDWVQHMTDRDAAAGMLSRYTATLAQVERSLQAMNDETYGYCSRCEGQIAIRRLQSIPWAPYCVRCQEAVESAQADGLEVEFDRMEAA